MNNNTYHSQTLQRLLTRTQGEFVSHFIAIRCSCSPEGEHPLATCLVCGGSGRAYERAEKRLKGIVAQINNQDKALLQSGMAMPGDLTFSPDVRPTIPLHDYDIVRLSYAQPYEGDLCTRGEDTTAYVIGRVYVVEQHNPVTGERTRYTQGTDFTTNERQITWLDGRGPAEGDRYSIRYDAIYDWVVYPGVTMQRVQRSVSLGQRVLLRKRHLAGVIAVIPG